MNYSIKIVTYNIAGLHKTYYHNNVLNTLKSIDNVDIICLQEVAGESITNTQAHAIGKALNMRVIFGKAINIHINNKTGVFGNAILTRLTVKSYEIITLPDTLPDKNCIKYKNILDGSKCNSNTENRIAIKCVISPIITDIDADFMLICTHLGLSTSYPSEILNPAYKLDKIVANVDKHMEIFIAGDFNSSINQPIINKFKTDGWRIPIAGATFKNKQIDYIIDKTYRINRTDKVWQATRKQYILDSNASDHRPLIDELVYTYINSSNNI